MIPETTDSSFHDGALHLATHNIHFSRILVGTDYSKQARLALKMAITIGEISAPKSSSSMQFLLSCMEKDRNRCHQNPSLRCSTPRRMI